MQRGTKNRKCHMVKGQGNITGVKKIIKVVIKCMYLICLLDTQRMFLILYNKENFVEISLPICERRFLFFSSIPIKFRRIMEMGCTIATSNP